MAANAATSSGVLNADTAVLAIPGRLIAVQVLGDGINQASAVLYDNASAASGLEVAKIILDAGLTDTGIQHISDEGVVCNNGIYLDISGTGAECIVYYVAG